ncbi:MAG TPA: FG-GAP-like repeat-containing protein, partial [Tahibacter sp.]|nr:FG-GAP-like repeat-containing protein [Tahibacter sp.]
VTVPVAYANDLTAATVTNLATASGSVSPAVSASDTNASDNAPPVATAASVSVGTGASVAIVLTGSDADSDPLTFRVTTPPSHGTLSGTAPNLTYTPDAGYTGPDIFAFVANDGSADSAPATIAINVRGPNQAPQITSTPLTRLREDAAYAYDVEATDPDDDVIAYALHEGPSGLAMNATSGMLDGTLPAVPVESLERQNLACRAAPRERLFDPVVKWTWNSSAILPDYKAVMTTPLVIQASDDNGDGQIDTRDMPDVAFIAYGGRANDGVIRIVSGDDGHELVAVSNTAARVGPMTHLAAADLDGDGRVEIVAVRQPHGLIAVKLDGTLLWATAHDGTGVAGAPSIADLDGDGSPEILYGKRVYGANGQLRWEGAGIYRGSLGNSGPTNHSPFSVAADVRADVPGMEVIAGPSLYAADGTLLWQYDPTATGAVLRDGPVAVADLDGEGAPEIVIVGIGSLLALRAADGALVWSTNLHALARDSGNGGPPTVADFDGDGSPDIGVAGQTNYVAIDARGRFKWKRAIYDTSSMITGSTAFDFDGDEAMEVVSADHNVFRILDGATGAERYATANTNWTQTEYAVVADVDADGSADILVPYNPQPHFPNLGGLRMFSSASRNWVPARSLWNQHAYHVDNIGDDGRVPVAPAKTWQTSNTFRVNRFPDRDALDLPDLGVYELRYAETAGQARLTVRARNRGLIPAGATTVRFYAGD